MTDYFKITEWEKLLETLKEDGVSVRVTRDEKEDIKIKIKLMQEAQEFKEKELLDKIEKMIDEIENPYPTDIFPKIKLSEFQSHTINDFLCSHLRITLDGFSAELMRRARETLKEELKQKLKGADKTFGGKGE